MVIPILAQDSAVNSNPFFFDQVKAYGAASHTKALGSDPALASWYEEAWAELKNGNLSSADRAQLIEWMNWAYAQLCGQQSYTQNSPVGGDTEVWGDSFDYTSSTQPSAPAGAFIGANGEYIYDQREATLYFTGDPTVTHCYSLENDLEIASVGAEVTCEITSDGLQPASNVLKVIVKSPYGEQVFFFQNFDHEDFELNIKAANPEGVIDTTGLQDKINIEEFSSQSDSTQSSLKGEKVEGEEDATYYEVETVNDTLYFTPKAGEENETETHYLVGNADISTPVSSTVNVLSSDNPEYDYMIVVTHKNGSKDIFYTRDEFKTNINAVEDYITFDLDGDGVADGEAGKVPNALKDSISVNVGVAEAGASSSNDTIHPDYPEDSIPDEIDGTEAHFTTQMDVSLHTHHDGDIKDIYITTAGEVEIFAADFTDKVSVFFDPSDQMYHIFVKKSDGTEITYHVDGPPSKIRIQNALPRNIYIQGDENQNYLDMDSDDIPEEYEIVEVEGGTTPEISEGDDEEVTWPGVKIMENMPTDGGNYDKAVELANKIADAINNSTWEEVENFINSLSSGKGNDVIRKLITGIYLAAGSDDEQFNKILDMIPSHIRTYMKNKVLENSGEINETHTGDLWNSAVTAAKIQGTLDE